MNWILSLQIHWDQKVFPLSCWHKIFYPILPQSAIYMMILLLLSSPRKTFCSSSDIFLKWLEKSVLVLKNICFTYIYQIFSSTANRIRKGNSETSAFSGTVKSSNLCSIITFCYLVIYRRKIFELIHLDNLLVWSFLKSKFCS